MICRLGLLREVAAGFVLSVVGEVFVDAGVEALRVAGECEGADLVVFVDKQQGTIAYGRAGAGE